MSGVCGCLPAVLPGIAAVTRTPLANCASQFTHNAVVSVALLRNSGTCRRSRRVLPLVRGRHRHQACEWGDQAGRAGEVARYCRGAPDNLGNRPPTLSILRAVWR